MWRHIASNALTLFIVLLFLLGGAIAGELANMQPRDH
jgi:hypothetical protein